MKRTGYAAALLLPLIFLCSCGVQSASRDMFAMDTVISVQAHGNNSNAAVNAAADRIKELEKLFSVTDADSDISHINASGTAEVSGSTEYVLTEALKVCADTDGALDITIYPVLREWGFTTSEYRVPTNDEIAAALAETGYERVSVSGNTVTVPAGYMLDLGSCAKGYAGDEALAAMREAGVTSALVNLGGNVAALGTKPDGSDWSVGIANPFSPNELLGIVKVHDKSVVTSGGYQRYFTDEDGNTYIHILDPATGRPAGSGLVSVTVIGENGLLCDALSTALFVMGKDKATGYRQEHGGFGMVLVTADGRIYITDDIAGTFTNKTEMPIEVIHEQ